MAEEAESVLRKLGERGDIIKRIHRGLAERRSERAAADFVVDGETRGDPIIGRLLARGLDDELKGSAFAVIDGTDGRTHHLRLRDFDAASDAAIGAVVEAWRLPSRNGGSPFLVLAVRSDLSIEDQIHAEGATWLDRRLVAKEPTPLAEAGFGREVQTAMEARSEHLVAEGLGRRQAQRFIFASNLLATLRQRELANVGAKLADDRALPYHAAAEGDSVAGVYRQRLNLASGRFAMIDDGLGFSLVPWSPSLERELGKQVVGVGCSFSRKRGLGL